MKTESSCLNGLHIPLFAVGLLLLERNFGHHTKSTLALIKTIGCPKQLKPKKISFEMLNEKSILIPQV